MYRVVIADDEVLIRMYIREILENNGYCQTAHCGRGKSHFIFGGLASPMVPYRNLPQAPDGMIADCCSLV